MVLLLRSGEEVVLYPSGGHDETGASSLSVLLGEAGTGGIDAAMEALTERVPNARFGYDKVAYESFKKSLRSERRASEQRAIQSSEK